MSINHSSERGYKALFVTCATNGHTYLFNVCYSNSNAFRRRSIAREIAREMRGGFSMYWLFTNFSVRVIFKTLTEKLFHSDQYCKGFVFSKRGIKFNNKVTILKRAHSLACLKISQLRRHGKKRVHTTESGERRVSSAWT